MAKDTRAVELRLRDRTSDGRSNRRDSAVVSHDRAVLHLLHPDKPRLNNCHESPSGQPDIHVIMQISVFVIVVKTVRVGMT